MSDKNKNISENNNPNQQENNNGSSLYMYTALIFLAAIIIIILAYFAQTNVERSQPSMSPDTVAVSANADAPAETGGPQGIAKTAAELSQDNLELLEENRMLHNRVDELESQLHIYEPLTEAYYASDAGDTERAKLLLEDIDYDALSVEAKSLYDFISSNIQ